MFKTIMSSKNQNKDGNNAYYSTIKEYIGFMPHVLDFENKRALFKREIKKLRKSS